MSVPRTYRIPDPIAGPAPAATAKALRQPQPETFAQTRRSLRP